MPSGTSADLRKMAGRTGARDRSRGPHRNSGLDRFAHARHPCGAELQHRSELDRHAIARGSRWIESARPLRRMPPGAWLIVAGGWNVTAVLGESAANAGGTGGGRAGQSGLRPVGLRLGDADAEGAGQTAYRDGRGSAPGGKLERDPDGKPTGGISGGPERDHRFVRPAPVPTPEQEVEGTKKFFRELNRLGLTGVVDPGGNNMTPESYQALFQSLAARPAHRARGLQPERHHAWQRSSKS